jgi:hypothetical protein
MLVICLRNKSNFILIKWELGLLFEIFIELGRYVEYNTIIIL